LYEKTGEFQKAAELTDNLLGRPAGLSQMEQEELRQINRRVKQK
jgi:hypothetical protein